MPLQKSLPALSREIKVVVTEKRNRNIEKVSMIKREKKKAKKSGVQSSPVSSSSSYETKKKRGRINNRNRSHHSISQDRTDPPPLSPPSSDAAACSPACSARYLATVHLHQLPRQVQKHLVDVEASPRRRLVERHATPLAGEVVRAVLRDLPVALEIRLVADHDDGHFLNFFDP